ncbi:MAG TPA: hypothetical protein VEW46_18660, partial [Pyrinomonadaceae bacterium]|nr:hypothetical protein [Pyrinomonadaceae bacterium]
MRTAFYSSRPLTILLFTLAITIGGGDAFIARAQQTNPVDRKVTNPMTDTPNVNPLTQDQPIRQPAPRGQGEPAATTD